MGLIRGDQKHKRQRFPVIGKPTLIMHRCKLINVYWDPEFKPVYGLSTPGKISFQNFLKILHEAKLANYGQNLDSHLSGLVYCFHVSI